MAMEVDGVCEQHGGSLKLDWNRPNSDIIEDVLSRLPVRSIVRSCVVCQNWHSLITQALFTDRLRVCKKPWFFLYGQNNNLLNQAFGFDPDANEWFHLPTSSFPQPFAEDSLTVSGGFLFATTASDCSRFCYALLLKSSWKVTAPLRFSRRQPLVGVFREGHYRFIVVGDVRFTGGLVDIEDRLPVEIYDTKTDSWELCAPLPAYFRDGDSLQSLTSALLKGKFYVFGIYSGCISAFDLQHKAWGGGQSVSLPPGTLFSYLLACQNNLILGCVRPGADGPMFDLWKVEEESMALCEVGSMPEELLSCLLESDEDFHEDYFLPDLRCVGLGSLIYVFSENRYKMYPAVVCDISPQLDCTWTKVPPLPLPVNTFDNVIRFCSTVSLDSIL